MQKEYEIEQWVANRGQKFCSHKCRGLSDSCKCLNEKIYCNYDWLTYQYITLHKSTRTIAFEQNVKHITICRWMKRLNVPRRSYSECQTGMKQSINTINKRAQKLKGIKRSDISRLHLSAIRKGSLNPAWKGGYYRKKYCYKFNKELKDSIRTEHNYQCFLCDKYQIDPGLNIHHIDYNCNAGCKNQRFALVPLCSSCHGKTNYNRWYWFNLLINYWAMNEEINFKV